MAPTRQSDAPEAKWASARLIPSVGIRSAKEAEARATSSFLAVMSVVPGFGKAIVSKAGGPAGLILDVHRSPPRHGGQEGTPS